MLWVGFFVFCLTSINIVFVEKKHFDEVLAAFRYYSIHARMWLERRRKNYNALSVRHKVFRSDTVLSMLDTSNMFMTVDNVGTEIRTTASTD